MSLLQAERAKLPLKTVALLLGSILDWFFFCTLWVLLVAVGWRGTMVEGLVFSRTGGRLRNISWR